ncbi:MAG TPA: hypothetical protein VGG10_00660 [Rhizomicrobium sp.]|jgi:hypothetical protein
MKNVVAIGRGKKKRTLVEAHTPPSPESSAKILPLRGPCPWSDELTAYDFENLALYACLLDAEEQDATLEEMAAVIFHIDPARNPAWAVRVVLSHLKRAHWIDDRIFPCFD